MAGTGGAFGDLAQLLRSSNRREPSDSDAASEEEGEDIESQHVAAKVGRILVNNNASANATSSPREPGGVKDLVRNHLDRGLSPRRLLRSTIAVRSGDSEVNTPPELLSSVPNYAYNDEVLGDSAPPEWALLLIGCLLGLASGLFVALFNIGVHVIHDWAWAGTPSEGAAWLRLQRLADTWHRILLIPVTGGIIVGMMHGLVEILNQIRQTTFSQNQGIDLVAGVFPSVKAIQAAVTLGTGCSLGPEGPSVDIGISCANGFSVMMENNRERKMALVAAGAAAGISSGFNAAVAGCFFAIETVLRPNHAENSPPVTTAMIILASVISSTVSTALLGTKSAFTVPNYDLKSAAELPLYLILGMVCGVVSVAFQRMVMWFTWGFEHIKKKFGLPTVVCPALGGLGAGLIALKYPGILYWGFTNVEEILHTGKSASAPGIWLLTQLAAAKVVATALCKGSGLVGGLYAPSLMIGAAVGGGFGGSWAKTTNSAIPGNAAVAQPQAYALVGMAATLASVCRVPLTSVLLMFELTKDYRIILPLMGAVGLSIWVPSVANQAKEESAERGYSSLSQDEERSEIFNKRTSVVDSLELSLMENNSNQVTAADEILLEDIKVVRAMSKSYIKVGRDMLLRDAIKSMHESHQRFVLVMDKDDLLEGILTYGDATRVINSKDEAYVNKCVVSSVCTKGFTYRGHNTGLVTCYPEHDLSIAKDLMEARGIKQLPVVKRSRAPLRERRRRLLAVLPYDAIFSCLREEMAFRRRGNDDIIGSSH